MGVRVVLPSTLEVIKVVLVVGKGGEVETLHSGVRKGFRFYVRGGRDGWTKVPSPLRGSGVKKGESEVTG